MPVNVYMTREHKRLLFAHFVAQNASCWTNTEAKAKLQEIPTSVAELRLFQYSQLRRQWRLFCSYIVVLRAVSKDLLKATTTLMSNERDIKSATSFGLVYIGKVWSLALLPGPVSAFIQRHVARLEHDEDRDRGGAQMTDEVTADAVIYSDLQAFVGRVLLPQYLEVWHQLSDAEYKISETMCGNLWNVLDDLDLEFQTKRTRNTLDQQCTLEWQATRFAKLFECGQDDELLRHITELLADAGQAEMVNLPPFFREYLEAESSVVWMAASLRIFEAGIYRFYVENVAWNGHLVFQSNAASSSGVFSPPPSSTLPSRTSEELERITSILGVDGDRQLSMEHMGTVLYITGAAMRRVGRMCIREQSEEYSNLSALFLIHMPLPYESALTVYGTEVLSKLRQRERQADTLIIPPVSLLRIFYRIETIISDIVDNPRHCAVLGQHIWKVLHAAVVAAGVVEDLSSIVCEVYSEKFASASTQPSSGATVEAACRLAIRYYILSVRTKDKTTMMNFAMRRDGTEKLSFRQQVAAKLADAPLNEAENELSDDALFALSQGWE